jgi:CRISPR-associated protein Cas1
MGKRGIKLVLNTYGNYLGMEKGCIILRDKNGGTKKYPYYEADIDEVILTSGNTVSTGVLTTLGFWEINVLISTRKGQPIAVLKNLKDDSHVKTRVCQYEATKNRKGVHAAKRTLACKILSQNEVLRKYGLIENDSLKILEQIEELDSNDIPLLRRRLNGLEGKSSMQYFQQIFSLFPEELRPKMRKGYHAYDGVNNLFNLGYELLFWKCYEAIIRSHLEAYLGFLHANVNNRPSLVCDLQELYRYLIDDFLIEYCKKLSEKDFSIKSEMFNDKRGKRIYLNDSKTDELTNDLRKFFRTRVKIRRLRNGLNQEIESLIYEESGLLAKYLRGEKSDWTPRIVSLT